MAYEKFCKDCRHMGDLNPVLTIHPCLHPSALDRHLDLVTGEMQETRMDCYSQRLGGDIFVRSDQDEFPPRFCGAEGHFWEPHEIGFGET